MGLRTSNISRPHKWQVLHTLIRNTIANQAGIEDRPTKQTIFPVKMSNKTMQLVLLAIINELPLISFGSQGLDWNEEESADNFFWFGWVCVLDAGVVVGHGS